MPLVTLPTNCTYLLSLPLGINRLQARPTRSTVRATSSFNRCHTDVFSARVPHPFRVLCERVGLLLPSILRQLSTKAHPSQNGRASNLHYTNEQARLYISRVYISRIYISRVYIPI